MPSGNESLEAGEEDEISITPHVLPLLSHNHQRGRSAAHMVGRKPLYGHLDADEVNMQDFIHNASKLYVV